MNLDGKTNTKHCRWGGKPGGVGHIVSADKMTVMEIKGNIYHLCEDCKARKLRSLKKEYGRQKNNPMALT